MVFMFQIYNIMDGFEAQSFNSFSVIIAHQIHVAALNPTVIVEYYHQCFYNGTNNQLMCYYYTGESPSKVQGVTVTRTVQGAFPALRVSWSAAVSSHRRGSYSDRVQRNTCNGQWYV